MGVNQDALEEYTAFRESGESAKFLRAVHEVQMWINKGAYKVGRRDFNSDKPYEKLSPFTKGAIKQHIFDMSLKEYRDSFEKLIK